VSDASGIFLISLMRTVTLNITVSEECHYKRDPSPVSRFSVPKTLRLWH